MKYPGFIFLCPQKLSKKNPRKKPKSLNYPNTIPEFFSEFGYVQDFFYVPRTIRGKKPNTLNYPIIFWNIAKNFQIVFRYFKHLDRLYLSFACKDLQCRTALTMTFSYLQRLSLCSLSSHSQMMNAPRSWTLQWEGYVLQLKNVRIKVALLLEIVLLVLESAALQRNNHNMG